MPATGDMEVLTKAELDARYPSRASNESLARDLRQTAAQIEALSRQMGKPVEALPLSVKGLREAAARLEAEATRYFLGCDNDCHDYLVPFDKKGEWEQWVASISVDVFSMSQEEADAIDWNPPSFARRIDNAFCITFTDPKEF